MILNKISIIVPVYGVEQYLPRCIDSILGQTYSDFELILVDDESPDQCGEICDAYAAKDNRVKVIHKDNGGVSNARNVGLDIASGEYVAFCDSDDYWDKTLLEETCRIIKQKKTDWVAFSFRMVFDDGASKEHNYPIVEKCFSSWEDKLDFFVADFLQGKTGWAVWARLYRREIIERYHIRFSETCNNYAEDMGFCGKYLLCANSIVSIGSCLYNYYQRDTSMMARSKAIIKLHELNEVSYDIGMFARKLLPLELYNHSIGLIHHFVMNNQYKQLLPEFGSRRLSAEFNKIMRTDWFRQNTKATIKSMDALKMLVGKNPARLIILFLWGALHGNWYPYLVARRISNLRHRYLHR